LWLKQRHWRAGIASLLNLSFTGFVGLQLVGLASPVAVWRDALYMAMLLGMTLFVGLGVLRGAWWSRWLGLGLALATLLSFGTGVVGLIGINGWAWVFCLTMSAGALLVLVNLAGPAMALHYEKRRGVNGLWRLDQALV